MPQSLRYGTLSIKISNKRLSSLSPRPTFGRCAVSGRSLLTRWWDENKIGPRRVEQKAPLPSLLWAVKKPTSLLLSFWSCTLVCLHLSAVPSIYSRHCHAVCKKWRMRHTSQQQHFSTVVIFEKTFLQNQDGAMKCDLIFGSFSSQIQDSWNAFCQQWTGTSCHEQWVKVPFEN